MAEKKPITNQVIEAIKKRRSVRRYQDRPIPRDLLKVLIEAGNMAPGISANRISCRFVVVENRDFIRKLWQDHIPKRQRYLEAFKKVHPEEFEKRKKLTERMKKGLFPIYRSAPVLLFVIFSTKPFRHMSMAFPELKGKGYGIIPAMILQNIALAAYSLGIGSLWWGFGAKITDDPEILKVFELKDDEIIYGPLLLGYPEVYPEPPSRNPPVVKWI